MPDKTKQKDKIGFLSIFHNFPQPLFLINPKDYSIVYVNKNHLKITGLSKEEIIGKRCFEVIHNGIRPCRGTLVECPLKETLKTGKIIKAEHIHYNKNKSPHYTEVITSLIKTPSGKKNLILHLSRTAPLLKKLSKSVDKMSREYLRQLRSLAMKDPLTGAYNYRYLMERLSAEVYRYKRYNDSFSAAIIDIDYFKSINDLYGHKIGDILLADLAKFIKRLLRRSDILFRYSGEEFIILMPNTGRLDTSHFCNRIINKITSHTFRIKGINIKIKVSIGTVSFSEDASCNTAHKLLNAVDKALQRAKDSGGNVAMAYSDLYKQKKTNSCKINTYEEISFLKRKVKRLTYSVDRVVLESIYAFSKSLEARDYYTAEHAEEMVLLVLKLGKELGLNKDMLNNLEKGAMLHDIGKIGISDAILRKKSKLTPAEYRIIKTHPKIGAEIIRAIHFLKDVVPIVLHHHEKWNGKGYPSGLKAREIPLLARIVSITDAYQALISDRPYRRAYSKKEAFEILKEEAGKSYDRDLVEVLIRIEAKKN